MTKILYGCCYKADLELENITYVDIIPGLKKSNNCNYICDTIENINFSNFDILLLTPPCNYYSRCNYRRDISQYALNTKHLLPYCIKAANASGKDFIVENVRNPKLFNNCGIFDYCLKNGIFVYYYGRHTYFTNKMIDLSNVPQRQDFLYGGKVIKYDDMKNKEHQGGYNVNNVLLRFISICLNKEI